MKSTGMIRKLDELGRITLPKEIRDNLKIKIQDLIEIYVNGSSIILKKYKPNCILCGTGKDLIEVKEQLICAKCVEELKML